MIRFVVLFIVVAGLFLSLGSNNTASAQSAEVPSEDVRIVALTILAEARGEGSEGMEAVACVIQQRTMERKISPSKVCLQKLQFSCWNNKMTADKLSAQVTRKTSKEVVDFAVELAQDLVAGKDLDRSSVQFANHYCTLQTFPKWAKGETPVKVIGNHKFYRL
jgi:N-acetylmuramoyl-L-alanine amidase